MCRLADHWSQHSTCLQRKIGAVVFDPMSFAVYGLGYNDTPIGKADCGHGGCVECQVPDASVVDLINCACVHAEMNALFLSRRDLRGTWIAIASRKGGEVSPKDLCDNCRKHLLQAGVLAWCQVREGDQVDVKDVKEDKLLL